MSSLFSGAGEERHKAALSTNLQICACTAPGLAAMGAATGRAFIVGKSMGVRRRDLDRLGGLCVIRG